MRDGEEGAGEDRQADTRARVCSIKTNQTPNTRLDSAYPESLMSSSSSSSAQSK